MNRIQPPCRASIDPSRIRTSPRERSVRCFRCVAGGALLFTIGLISSAVSAATKPVISVAPESGRHAELAAREVRRYVYLRCRTLLPIEREPGAAPPAGVVLLEKTSPWLPATLKTIAAACTEEGYVLRSTGSGGHRIDWIVGGGDIGLLYGAYRFAEKLGVRFYLHGDVVPDTPLHWDERPAIDEIGRPLFATRGILPFHDFPEGPDWWTADDYALYLGQLPKMRMNFAGFHCYPESLVGPEPLVWIGQKMTSMKPAVRASAIRHSGSTR